MCQGEARILIISVVQNLEFGGELKGIKKLPTENVCREFESCYSVRLFRQMTNFAGGGSHFFNYSISITHSQS